MNEKVKYYFTVAFLALLCCCATRITGGTDPTVIDHQAEIDRLENELRNRDRAIDNAVRELEGITARSAGMEGTVDEVIRLFDDYQQAVEQLLRDYYKVRGAPQAVQECSERSDYSTDSYVGAEDSRLRDVYERGPVAAVAGHITIGGNK